MRSAYRVVNAALTSLSGHLREPDLNGPVAHLLVSPISLGNDSSNERRAACKLPADRRSWFANFPNEHRMKAID